MKRKEASEVVPGDMIAANEDLSLVIGVTLFDSFHNPGTKLIVLTLFDRGAWTTSCIYYPKTLLCVIDCENRL